MSTSWSFTDTVVGQVLASPSSTSAASTSWSRIVALVPVAIKTDTTTITAPPATLDSTSWSKVVAFMTALVPTLGGGSVGDWAVVKQAGDLAVALKASSWG